MIRRQAKVSRFGSPQWASARPRNRLNFVLDMGFRVSKKTSRNLNTEMLSDHNDTSELEYEQTNNNALGPHVQSVMADSADAAVFVRTLMFRTSTISENAMAK